MSYEQKVYVRDDDVTSHVTSLNFFLFRFFLAYFEGNEYQIVPISYNEPQGNIVRDDFTSHVTILNSFVLLVSCLFRKLRMPKYSMSYETHGCVFSDGVTSHVTIF